MVSDDHERIPERIVHARGSTAHGYFECSKSLNEYTCASLFAEVGKQTPVFVRFSTEIVFAPRTPALTLTWSSQWTTSSSANCWRRSEPERQNVHN